MARRKRNYINNADFYQAMVTYHESGKTKETKYMVECIMHIAKKLATSPNFRGYTYLDDMIR